MTGRGRTSYRGSASERRRVPLYALFVADTISLSGNVVALVAIPWFVLQETGSAALTGVSGFFTWLPVVIAALLPVHC